ncbi:MAG: hypothetical protein D8G53_10580 [Candidatus Saccharimonas sp.]|nr:MAG: hypothetical protein D8G53_10580 [Candidatus Saccharimonas sp.]
MSRNIDKDKKAILTRLSKMPIVEIACKQVGIPRSTYYRWRKADKNFANACDEAIERSADVVNDIAESQLIAAIKNKDMRAITFWLKHRHAAYRNKLELSGKVETKHELLPAEMLERLDSYRRAGLIELEEDAHE